MLPPLGALRLCRKHHLTALQRLARTYLDPATFIAELVKESEECSLWTTISSTVMISLHCLPYILVIAFFYHLLTTEYVFFSASSNIWLATYIDFLSTLKL